MNNRPVASPVAQPTISIRCESPGVVLAVRGGLDSSACELLGEVVRAALVAVRHATRIHLDLSGVSNAPERLPRLVRRLERAGATVTRPRKAAAAPPVDGVRHARAGGVAT